MNGFKLIPLALLLFSGCAMTNTQQCRTWQNDGVFTGTVESCTQCIETLGKANISAVQGCALGLDAAKLFNTGN